MKEIIIIYLITSSFLANAQVWQLLDTTGFTPFSVEHTNINVINDTPYVSFEKTLNKASVMKFNGTHWEYVGNSGFTPGQAGFTTLANDGIYPYIAFRDGPNQNKVSVMKFNGTSWVNVGNPGFTDLSATKIHIAMDTANTPYVVYKEGGAFPYGASVMKFNGSTWEHVGAKNFSIDPVDFTEIAFDSKNTPYVVYRDEPSNSALVKKFDGTNWITVGGTHLPNAKASFTSIALDVDTPYVAFSDENDSFKVVVMKFDGNNWITVGSPHISPFSSFHVCMKVYGGIPFVAFDGHYGLGTHAMAKRFDGVNWVDVGNANISSGEASDINIALDNNHCYITYMDWAKGNKATAHKIYLNTNVGVKGVEHSVNQLKLSPNPTNGILQIEANSKTTFQIINVFGSIIFSGELNEKNSFNTNYLFQNKGIYFISSSSGNSKVIVY